MMGLHRFISRKIITRGGDRIFVGIKGQDSETLKQIAYTAFHHS
jgi:hypothetical protein